MRNKRTINEVLDMVSGQEIVSLDFFRQPEQTIFRIRREIEESYQDNAPPHYVCYFCKQRIKINGGLRKDNVYQIYHFAHYKDSDDCPIKTGSSYSEEEIRCIKYNGAKESKAHFETKEAIGKYLRSNENQNLGVSNVIIDKVLKADPISKRWRKPDVRCEYKGMNLVFEIQLSTTFLSVIAERERYYRGNGIFIIWVFKGFSIESQIQRFAQKDIFYGNNCNVYVLDDTAIRTSELLDNLILKCYYIHHEITENQIVSKWLNKHISLSDLKFQKESAEVWYFDSDGQRSKFQREIDVSRQKELDKANAKLNQEQRKKQDKIEAEKKYKQQNIELSNDILAYDTPIVNLLLQQFSYDQTEVFDFINSNPKLTDEDKGFLKISFEKGAGNFDNLPRKDFADKVAGVTFVLKGAAKGLRTLPYGVLTVLYALLSLKTKKIIGFTHKKHIMIAYKILDSRKEYYKLFLHAVDHYKMRDQILEQDKEGKLQARIERLQKENIKQNTIYIPWVKANFPELFL